MKTKYQHKQSDAARDLGRAKREIHDALLAIGYNPESATSEEQILVGVLHQIAAIEALWLKASETP